MSIQLSLDVSPELNKMLNEIKNKTGSSTEQVLIKSIVLMSVAINERELGNQVSITRGNKEIIKEIIGF